MRHFPGARTNVPELNSPGHFYREAAALVAGWVEEQGKPPLTLCDVGAGTGRTVYELSQRLTSVAEFTAVEPSATFCDWMSRLLTAAPEDLCIPTPGSIGDPRHVLIPAHLLRCLPVSLRVLNADVSTVAGNQETYDVVTCFNVLDRVPDPAGFTSTLSSLVAPGGLLVMACPFDFEPMYSPPEAWVTDLRDVIPADAFDIVGVTDVPYTFKQFDRRFNWYLTQVVAARRRCR